MIKKFFHYLFLAITRRKAKASMRLDLYGTHVLDETQAEPTGGWINLHGYNLNDGEIYIGADYRWLGIRIQNVIIKCKDQATYDKWVGLARTDTGSFYEHVTDELPYKRGNEVDTCYVFHTTDGKDKEYNIDQSQDVLAEA